MKQNEKEFYHGFTLPELPYAKDALVPICRQKHLNSTMANTIWPISTKPTNWQQAQTMKPWHGTSRYRRQKRQSKLFNQIGQIYNHNLFWLSMAPNAGGVQNARPSWKKLPEDIGGYDALRAALIDKGMTQFGSGWAWLVLDNATGKLEVLNSANAETPLTDNKTLFWPVMFGTRLLHRLPQRPPKFLEAWIDNLANWEYAAKFWKKNFRKNTNHKVLKAAATLRPSAVRTLYVRHAAPYPSHPPKTKTNKCRPFDGDRTEKVARPDQQHINLTI